MQLAEAERLVAVPEADLDIARNVLAVLAGVAEVGARKCIGSEDSEGDEAECRTHCLLLFTGLVEGVDWFGGLAGKDSVR